MKSISWRLQLELIGAAYAAIILFGLLTFFQRQLAQLRDPMDAQSAMWAFGDLILSVFLFLLCLVPTFFLLRLMAESDTVYSVYAKFVLAASLTAPLCMGLLALFHRSLTVQNVCVTRLLWAPFVLLVMAMSRFFGRRNPGRRLITRALVIESGTMIVGVAVFVAMAAAHH